MKKVVTVFSAPNFDLACSCEGRCTGLVCRVAFEGPSQRYNSAVGSNLAVAVWEVGFFARKIIYLGRLSQNWLSYAYNGSEKMFI